MMTAAELGNYRITSQGIATAKFRKPAEAVAHLGAMQAQDFPMSRWAVGLRTAKATDAGVLAAYDKGEIIRTHLLRPTWHLVANADIDWMTRLTAPAMIASMRGQYEQRSLSEGILQKSNQAMEKILTASGPLVREELFAALKKAKINCTTQNYPYLLFHAELSRVICSGPMRGKKTTYALYAERIKKTPVLKRDEALAKLAERYFTSHGPATFADFSWWSGLKVEDARTAYAAVEKQFSRESIGEDVYLIPKNLKAAPDSPVHLLPAFDEFIIAYKDRGAVLPRNVSPRVVSNNGIFRATIVANGLVRGIWKRETKKGKLVVDAEYFGKVDANLRNAVEMASVEFAKFTSLPLTR